MADAVQYSSSKRKYEDQAVGGPLPPRRQTGFSAPITSDASAPPSYNTVAPPADEIQLAKQRAQEIAARLFSNASTAEAKRPRFENGDDPSDYGKKPSGFQMGQGGVTPPLPVPYGFQGSTGIQGSSKKIDIPNGRVGVIIGKGGETIKYLQLQSGAKIQVTRDMDADPNSPNRLVELMGTSEQISKAEQLIKDVLAEAESGGSGLVSKRFPGQPGAEQFSMKVPNNKVGLIIGKGGETIKNMQARSGARIQLIPLHLPPGDPSTERTVYIDGNEQQIEAAKQLVNEVISENRVRNSSMGGGYSQQGFRPQTPSNWAPSGSAAQQPGYGYMQPGAYPGAPTQYNMSQPPYTGYPPQPNSTGWDQAPVTPNQQTTQGSGYDYYSQQPPQQPSVVGSSVPADNTGYNYNQPQGSYGGSTYSQPPAGQQQAYAQDGYGGYQAPTPQPGYGQSQTNLQPVYDQSYNSTTNYGTGVNPGQDGTISTYGTQSAATQVPPPIQAPTATPQAFGTQQPNTPPSYPTQGPQSGYPPPAQPGYGTQVAAQTGYGQSAPPTQASYGPPLGQKSIYGQTQPQSSQAGYIQQATVHPGYANAQSTPTHSGSSQPDSGHHRPPASAPQASYVQPPYNVSATSQPGYAAQQYGDSYGGAYSQPPVYPSDSNMSGNALGTYDAAPAAPATQPSQSGVVKTSTQS